MAFSIGRLDFPRLLPSADVACGESPSVLISAMEREELPHFPPSQNKSRSNLSFSISSILSSNEDSSKDLPLSDVEAASESDEESSSQIRIPLVQRPESSNMVSPASEAFSTSSSLATSMMSAEFSPWLYRPTPLPGYLPLQTGFLTSRFAGKNFSIHF